MVATARCGPVAGYHRGMANPGPHEIGGDTPLQVRARQDASLEGLCEWLGTHASWVQEALIRHGALLLRGFDVETPADFERVARAIDPDLQNEYLGTSPRDGLTEHVFNASELPDFFPIPQHCEMSFCARPPRRVFFCCLAEPAPGSGETPVCDFRAVWRDLAPEIRERFISRGIRIVRNYAPPGAQPGDPTQLKGWDEMFLTTDRAAVEAKCREEGFEPSWGEDGGLKLVHTQPVYRDHPTTGERAWHNHLTTFHRGTALAEYRRIAAYRKSERHHNLLEVARALDAELRSKDPEAQSMHCTHEDGSEIDDADIEAVRDAIWRHLVVTPWQRGDILVLDNHSTSHGRLPYEGPRHVAVCWA
jgi:alpha-ketoglutarate-dependent taurine dioxygenase